jgi:hypothetical protein
MRAKATRSLPGSNPQSWRDNSYSLTFDGELLGNEPFYRALAQKIIERVSKGVAEVV